MGALRSLQCSHPECHQAPLPLADCTDLPAGHSDYGGAAAWRDSACPQSRWPACAPRPTRHPPTAPSHRRRSPPSGRHLPAPAAHSAPTRRIARFARPHRLRRPPRPAAVPWPHSPPPQTAYPPALPPPQTASSHLCTQATHTPAACIPLAVTQVPGPEGEKPCPQRGQHRYSRSNSSTCPPYVFNFRLCCPAGFIFSPHTGQTTSPAASPAALTAWLVLAISPSTATRNPTICPSSSVSISSNVACGCCFRHACILARSSASIFPSTPWPSFAHSSFHFTPLPKS